MDAANLISAKSLINLIKNNNQPYTLLEIGYMNQNDYENDHIQGAHFMDSRSFESLPLWNFKKDQELIKLFQKYGLRQDRKIILYSRRHSAAARLAVLLLAFSFKYIYILDGGYDQWLTGGYPVSKNPPLMPKDITCHYTRSTSKCIINYEEFCSIYGKSFDQVPLVSIRSKPEYEGKISGYDYFSMKGMIPGSIHGGDISNYNNEDGTYVDEVTFANQMNALGISKSTPAIFYCGTGWRASVLVFLAFLYGYDNCMLYDGGWYEYSTINYLEG